MSHLFFATESDVLQHGENEVGFLPGVSIRGDRRKEEEKKMKRRIGSLVMAAVLVTSTLGIMATIQGCLGTKRSEIRQEERVEHRVDDRYERRRGHDD